MNKIKAGAVTVLVLGGATAIAAAAIPAGSIAPASTPVTGIAKTAEKYASSDPTAEEGMRKVIHDCMATAGFDYAPPNTTLVMDLHQLIGGKYLDVDTARTSGYTSPNSTEPAPSSPAAQQIADPAFVLALRGNQAAPPADLAQGYGAYAGGCVGEAATTIYGSTENYALATVVAYNSFSEATGSAMYDPEFVAATQDWADCMDTTAYPQLDTPQQALDTATTLSGQEEIKIAVTDATCRNETNLHERLSSVLDQYLTERVEELTSEIDAVTTIRTKAALNAEKVLSASW